MLDDSSTMLLILKRLKHLYASATNKTRKSETAHEAASSARRHTSEHLAPLSVPSQIDPAECIARTVSPFWAQVVDVKDTCQEFFAATL